MTREVRWCLVGLLALLALAGCGRSFFAQRESWRREAEVQCLQSGSVKEGPAVALLSPISGPGMCGADFPLKVGMLGDNGALGYADDEVRPPGAIRDGALRSSPGRTNRRISRPIDLAPPGAAPSPPDAALRAQPSYSPGPSAGPAHRGPWRPEEGRPTSSADPKAAASPYPPPFPSYGESVPISPARAPVLATQALAVSVTPRATLACPVVSALDRWVADAVQPAARRWFGRPVAEIKQISAYSCRGMNGSRYARISEHAFGNALDISAFTLADGRVVTVREGWRGAPEEQGFLRDVQAGACGIFSTVLAPGSNRFHYDHIHVDLMRRNSGRRSCDPAAVPGEVVAAQARRRGGYAQGPAGESGVTGTAPARRRAAATNARLPAAKFEDDRDPDGAMPGED